MLISTMNKKKVLAFSVLVILSFSCKHGITIVPVREAEFRAEYYLPLDDNGIKAALDFIANGGVNGAEGFTASIEPEPFRRFLGFFRDETNLTVKAFKVRPGLKEYINPTKPVYDVIDARESKGAYQNNRMAYRFKDFWFILIVDKLKDEDGQYIKDEDKRFARIIMMKTFDGKKNAK
jgi:hypothetical protein